MNTKTYFENKVVWITGASSGIGKEFCIQLDQMGAILILSSRNENALVVLKESLSHSKKHQIQVLDLEDSSEFKSMTNSIISSHKKIDLLINNGGISQRSNVADTRLSIDRKIMEVNFFGNIALSKAVLPHMIKNKSGHIVVISSIAGKFGFFLRSAYSASKHALHGFYESLALEQKDNGINVTMVCPGKINTPISTNALNKEGKRNGQMDNNQRLGLPVSKCVKKILKDIAKKKEESFVGGKEIYAVRIKNLFPRVFRKIIRKQSPT
tara:strand:+ start:5494 stop:6297 length:804 start_codon:yes stop_codon:yes gene_type:complete